MYKIESNIPFVRVSNGRISAYPVAQLEINESFFVPGKKPIDVSYAMKQASKKFPGRKFTAQTREENGVKGVRVWRLDAWVILSDLPVENI